jgi:glycosyltransferase involved in cell wall biosynthesis
MTLHNGFDLDDLVPDTSFAWTPDIINFVHTGRLGISRQETSGKGRGVDALSTSLQILLDRSPEMGLKFKLHFVGQLSQVERNCLAPLVKQRIVKLWGQQSRARAIGFQRKADVLLLITAPDKASIATGKLFEYLAANKPILALTRGTEAERIVRETGSGVVLPPDEPEAIAEIIERIIRNGGEVFGLRNEEIIADFSRDRQMAVLATMLKDV